MPDDHDREPCDRCGREGPDRRTLLMACFYEMREINHGYIPFKDETLFALTKPIEEAGVTLSKEPFIVDLKSIAPNPPAHYGLAPRKLNLGGAEVKVTTPLRPVGLYSLRVCKRCRSLWLDAIATWFRSQVPTPGWDSGD